MNTNPCSRKFTATLYLRRILLSLLMLAGFTLNAVANEAGVDAGYEIGPGDLLRISVWKEEGMQHEVLVKPDGAITFPLVGDVVASGNTTGQLTELLVARLKKFIPSPVVTVSVLNAASHKIYVVGKVARPGQISATHYIDVLQALSLAGGVTPFADADDIRIIRRESDGKQTFEFDYEEVIRGENLESNIELKAGDTIVVP